MRAALVVGAGLIGIGIITLAYFASPVRLLEQRSAGAPVSWVVPIVGGTAIFGGIALLFSFRPTMNKNR